MLNVLISLLFGPIHVAAIACNYSVLVGNFDWETGRQKCIDAGMDFTSIIDSTIQSEVETFLIENNPGSDVWLGLKWNVSKQKFYWVNDVSLNMSTWRNWASGEPNCMDTICMDPNTDYQDCVRMANGEWKTFYCNSAFVALCQSCLSTINVSSTSTNKNESTLEMMDTSTMNASDPSHQPDTRGPYSIYETTNQLTTNDRTTTTPDVLIETVYSTEVTGTTKIQQTYDMTPQTEHNTGSTNITPTTFNTYTTYKDNCKNNSNGCQCQRTMSNTTESVKMSDYIWLRKCKVQLLIESGVLNETDCPYTCNCFPKDTTDTDSSMYDMFACIIRR